MSFTSANPGDHFEALGRVGYEFKSETPSSRPWSQARSATRSACAWQSATPTMQGGYVENLAPANSLKTFNVATGA